MVVLHDSGLFINLCQHIKPFFICSSLEFTLFKVYEMSKQLGDRKIFVDCYDIPIHLNPYRGTLDRIADIVQRPAKDIIVYTPNLFHHDRVTIVPPVRPDSVEQIASDTALALKGLKFSLDKEPKKFGASFGRVTWVRVELAYWLERNLSQYSHVIFQSSNKHMLDETQFAFSDPDDYIQWAINRVNPPDSGKSNFGIGQYDVPYCIYQYPDIWGKYQIEIVVESDHTSSTCFSEKTFRCLGSGKPFILMAGHKSLENLRKSGYLTYSSVIDESYDEIACQYQRLDAIKKEIKRLSEMPDFFDQIKLLQNSIDHNQRLFFEQFGGKDKFYFLPAVHPPIAFGGKL